ncbi:MAG: hypothetical protein WC629_01740 [Candidatus Paceibacterota bacterium]|jgi:polyferredoxin
MEQLELKIAELEKKIDTMSDIVRKLYKTFLWTLILTVVMFLLPLVGLMFALPSFLSNYSSYSQISGL